MCSKFTRKHCYFNKVALQSNFFILLKSHFGMCYLLYISDLRKFWGVFFIEHLGAAASVTKNTGVTNKQHKKTGNMVDLTRPMFSFEYDNTYMSLTFLHLNCHRENKCRLT